MVHVVYWLPVNHVVLQSVRVTMDFLRKSRTKHGSTGHHSMNSPVSPCSQVEWKIFLVKLEMTNVELVD